MSKADSTPDADDDLYADTRPVRETTRGEFIVNIPREIRDRHNLEPGDRINFIDNPDADDPDVRFLTAE